MFRRTWITGKIVGSLGFKSKKMAYVYRHIRLDKNVPFYIGISADSGFNYTRSKNYSRDKSYIWRHIVAKTKYEIDIMMDGLTWEEACEKEKELIKLYGRINKKTGTLANLTDGGEGNVGQVVSKETRDRLSDINSIPVVQYDLNGKFIKLHKGSLSAAKYIGGKYGPVWACANLKKHNYTAYGFLWRKYEGHTNDIVFDLEKYTKTVFGRKGIKVYDKNGSFSESCQSISFAARKYNISNGEISSVLTGIQISSNNYIFRYEDGDYSDIDTKPLYRHINMNKRVPVVKLDIISGKELMTYESITMAAREHMGVSAPGISACCRKINKTAGGFKWEYKKIM